MFPTTYSAWLPLLDRFAEGDDAVLTILHGGAIEWTNVVSERFLIHITEALKKRLEALTGGLQKRLSRASSQVEVRGALAWAQQGLSPLGYFCSLPAFEDRVKQHLEGECRRWVERTQSSLETSARAVGAEPDSLQMLKSSGLRWPPLVFEIAEAQDSKKETQSAPAKSGPGRRVLL